VLSSGRNTARSGHNFVTVPEEEPVVSPWSRRVEKARKQSERLSQLGGLGAIKAVRQGVPSNVLTFHGDKDCLCGRESWSVGLVPRFHSMRVETPSPSWSRWTKPGIWVSIP